MNVDISQGNVATYLRRVRICKYERVANVPLSLTAIEFENRLTLGEVMGKSLVSWFLTHGANASTPGCSSILIHTRNTNRHTTASTPVGLRRLTALCPGRPGQAGTRKVKPISILLKQETVSGSGISWVVCKSAPRSRQITTPAPHHSVFTGRMPFLPPNQQRQSTEGMQIASAPCNKRLRLYFCDKPVHSWSTNTPLYQCRPSRRT